MRRWLCKLRGKHWGWKWRGGHEYRCRVCGALAPAKMVSYGDGRGGYSVDLDVKP